MLNVVASNESKLCAGGDDIPFRIEFIDEEFLILAKAGVLGLIVSRNLKSTRSELREVFRKIFLGAARASDDFLLLVLPPLG